MKKIIISEEKIDKAKNIIIFIVLLLWIIIPVFQSFFKTFMFVNTYDYTLMKIIAILGVYFFSYYLYRKIKKENNIKETLREIIPIIIFLIYMIWTLIACFMSPNKELAFYGTEYRQEGYITYITYAGFFLCAFLLDSKKLKKVLLNIFIIVSLFLLIASRIWSYDTRLIGVFMVSSPTQSVFWQFNHYGYYLTLSLMCCLGMFITEKKIILKIFYLIAYSLIGYNLVLNDTFGCYLAVAVTLILFLIFSLIKKKHRIVTIVSFIIFIILSCVVTKDEQSIVEKNIDKFIFDIKSIASKITNVNYNSEEVVDYNDVEEVKKQEQQIENNFKRAGTTRMNLWKHGISFIKESPIIGYGPENLKKKYEQVNVWRDDRPHNLLIQLATTSGIPGMLLYVIAVRNNCNKRNKKFKRYR